MSRPSEGWRVSSLGTAGVAVHSLPAWAPAGLLALLANYRSQRASGPPLARFGLVREWDSVTPALGRDAAGGPVGRRARGWG